VFGRGSALPWTLQDKIWLGGLLNWSFILILAGFTPSMMREMFSDPQSLWVAAHTIFLIVHLASYSWFGYSFFFYAGMRSFRPYERWIVVPSYVIASAVIAMQVYTAYVDSTYIQLAYVVATGWFIYTAAVAFAFMLFPREAGT
jgi:hypothetical protein